MRRWVDFLILAPLDVEIQALREAFKFSLAPTSTWSNANYWSVDLTGNDEQQLHVEVVQLPNPGILNTAVFTTRLILEWRPWCVVSFGIAGGFLITKRKKNDIDIKDVLVPGAVIYYEPAKETKEETSDHTANAKRQSRMKPYSVDERVRGICLETGRICGAGSGTLRESSLASGEKLISDVDAPTRKAIMDSSDLILAVEMEAAGVAAAVAECAQIVQSRLLVVKGISDDAGKGKRARTRAKQEADKENRAVAAENAANLLAATIKRVKPNYDHLSRLRNERHVLTQQVERFCEAIPKCLNDWDDRVQAERILKDVANPPPVYYHWRIRHPFVHWLDFCYLLVLRKLHNCGLPVCLLVTDVGPEVTEAAKANTRAIVDAVFANAANLIWYSEMKKRRDTYIHYATSQEFFNAIDLAVSGMLHMEGHNAMGQTKDWLYYIAWSAQPSKRCVILAWKQHLRIYNQLMHVLSLDCLLIPRPTIKLGGKRGKDEEPGKSILIEPPYYESILSWLESTPDIKHVTQLSTYLSLDSSTRATDEHIVHFLQGRKISLEEPNRSACLRALLGTMADWNATLFHEFGCGSAPKLSEASATITRR